MHEKYHIKKHINNITLNPYEYVLDDKEDVMLFPSEDAALKHLNENYKMSGNNTKEQWAEEGIYIELESRQSVKDGIYTALKNFSQCPNIWTLAHDLGIDTKSIDSAIPQPWADKLRKEMAMQPIAIAWDYRTEKFGGPVNMAMEILKKIDELIKPTLDYQDLNTFEINNIEVTSDVVEWYMRKTLGDKGYEALCVVENDMSSYTEEGQNIYNDLYDEVEEVILANAKPIE